jgi:hypothetical protein
MNTAIAMRCDEKKNIIARGICVKCKHVFLLKTNDGVVRALLSLAMFQNEVKHHDCR